MAVTTTQTKVACSLKLNAGTTETGARITKSVSLGSMKVNAFDAQKAYNIVNLLLPCLSYGLYQVQNTVTNVLDEDE